MPPKIIHQMWVQGIPIPLHIAAMMGTWREHHPTWEHRFWHAGNLDELVNQELFDRAHEITPQAPEQFQSDVARYEILLEYGGVWVDADFICQKPLDDLMGVDVFAGKVGRLLNNALIGAEPGHRLMAELVERLPANVARRRRAEGNPVKSGPHFFTPIARRHKTHEYPQHYFYPYLWNELHRGAEEFPESYAVHAWNNQRRQVVWNSIRPATAWEGGLSLTVMAHPKRADYVRELVPQLGFPDVVWDTRESRWDTARRAWLSYDPAHTHHTVCQDDAVPARHFLTHLGRALDHVPEVPLVLYAGATKRDRFKKVPRETSFVVMERIWWGVGITLPVDMIPDAIAWGDTERGDQYDHRLSAYFEAVGIPIWYTWPSLVDHRNGPSLVPGRGGGRRAFNFAGPRTQLKWTGKVIDLSRNLIE